MSFFSVKMNNVNCSTRYIRALVRISELRVQIQSFQVLITFDNLIHPNLPRILLKKWMQQQANSKSVGAVAPTAPTLTRTLYIVKEELFMQDVTIPTNLSCTQKFQSLLNFQYSKLCMAQIVIFAFAATFIKCISFQVH